MRTDSGATLIEIVLVVAIIMLLAAIIFASFRTLNMNKALDTESQHVLAELNRARALTLGSKDLSQFGVHFASSTMTLFEGASYAASPVASTTLSYMSSPVQIKTISLAGGGSDVIFQRLSGETSQTGNITLSLVSSASSTKTISIYASGAVDSQ